ncbi:hypothetical protein [Streptomyces soliscabiei]|uniref:hypothetical protein n=1 Tax=Streptomyces soliscabiei TaxID=588897 RepID=UPI0029B100B2|nr:hypothetical protein [Streptomyces sp. NY05-11A]MDX2681080.1 hypothetical protein [Streptomyces sp. NY05-11A]
MYDRPTPRQTTTGYGTCPDCSRRVLWCLTAKHRKIISIDPAEDPTGNQAVSVKDSTYWTRQLSADRPHLEVGETLRRPHIATCPIARAAAARARAAARRRTTSRARIGVRPVRWQR